ncbi:MAG TPA: hypothetical protein DC054_08335 [Blastocatellia bacterium]|nr:hypothetical protein [Blastocatellia bacterium]
MMKSGAKGLRESRGSLLRGMLTSIAIASVAFGVYVLYISPTASETFVSSLPILILGVVLAVLVALNMLYFAAQMKNARIPLVKHLPSVFLMAMLVFWFLGILGAYSFSLKRALTFFLVSLGIWLTLNCLGYLARSSGSSAS